MDEEIIELKERKKESIHNNIYEGVYINHHMYEFEKENLFQDSMSIMLPKDFITMPTKMAKIKYPSESRPQIIKTDYSGSINFTFSLFNMPIKENQIEGACKNFKKLLRNLQPSNTFFDEENRTSNGKCISLFDYKSNAVDCQVYNIVYVTSINGNILHGIFNCRYVDMEKWKPIANQVIDSIEEIGSDLNEN